ncbi:MAG: T9SS type A sorting domain-containing protein, partial [Chitinophagales bacterium]|nr:T9SS type A sorting domain-containing protein [Chitinophagales bacterium]
SISAISDQLPLEIYPNPATNVFHFVSQLNTHDVNWMLTNSFGIVVRSSVRNTVASGVYVQDVDVNDLPAGMYQLHLQSGGESKTKKIILAK